METVADSRNRLDYRRRVSDPESISMWQSTGKEQAQATVTIRDGSIKVEANHLGESVLHVIADAETWLAFLAKEKNLLWALLTRKIRLRGNPQWLLRFSGCFLG